MNIIIRSVSEEGSKFYSQVFLDDTTVRKRCSTKKLMFQKESTLMKQVHQKNVCFVIIIILKMFDLNSNMSVCNKCHVLMTAYEFKNIAILNVKGADFRCILWGISWDEAVNRLDNSVIEDKGVL